MELEIKAKDLELEEAKIKIHELSQFATSSNEQSMISKQVNVRDQMGKEFKNLFDNDYKQLFDLIFDLMKSYRSTWKLNRFYPLIYELLFNVLMTCFEKVHKYEENISLTLCDKFQINKSILYQSFYNEWIKNSNFEVFLSSTKEIGQIK